MGSFKLDRRTFLRGMLGGAAVTIGLPMLDIFMNDSGTALAGGSSFPTRFGIWYWGNGNLPALWTPANTGANWTPSTLLMPLAPVQQYVTVVSGMNILSPNTAPHGSGPAGLFTGSDLDASGAVTGPTMDQIIAKQAGSTTRFPSLEVGVQSSDSGIFFSGPNQPNPPETSPIELFNRVFVDGYRPPGDMSQPDPKLALRKSVLDAVITDAGRLRSRLGAADKTRIDAHLDGIRTLEQQVMLLQQSPPALAACATPAMPLPSYPDIDGRAQMSAISRVVSDIVAMALACDQTRVFSNMFSQPVNNTLFPNATEGHHQLTHDEPDPQPQVESILTFIMGELAYFIGALANVQEGDGTLLDHSAVLITSDVSLGRTHSLDDYPILIAGSGNGALNQGIHYHSTTGENACMVTLALLRMMGVHATSFGSGAAQTTNSLSAILA